MVLPALELQQKQYNQRHDRKAFRPNDVLCRHEGNIEDAWHQDVDFARSLSVSARGEIGEKHLIGGSGRFGWAKIERRTRLLDE